MTINLKGSSSATSARLALGWQLYEQLGIEGTWFNLPEAAATTPAGQAKYKGSAYAVSLSGNFPINADTKLVGRLGVGRSDVSVSLASAPYNANSAQNLTVWGLGARFNVNASMDLSLDYDNLGTVGKYSNGDGVKAQMLSLGLRYKF